MGIARLDVLRCATSILAHVMQMEAELGTLTQGKLAAPIVVAADRCHDVDRVRWLQGAGVDASPLNPLNTRSSRHQPRGS